jgi:hypothetical protein
LYGIWPHLGEAVSPKGNGAAAVRQRQIVVRVVLWYNALHSSVPSSVLAGDGVNTLREGIQHGHAAG